MDITDVTVQPLSAAPHLTERRPPVRARGDDAKAIGAALRSDWIKASTVRSNRAVLGLTAVGGLVVS